MGDIYALPNPFPETQQFDIVHLHQVLQHLGDPVSALQSLRTVLKSCSSPKSAIPTMIAAREADMGTMAWYPDEEGSYPGLQRWKDLWFEVARRNGSEPRAGRRLISWFTKAFSILPSQVYMGKEGEQSLSAGHMDVDYSLTPRLQYTTSNWTFADPASRRWWSETWAERISSTTSEVNKQAKEFGLVNQQDLEVISEGFRAWGRDPVAWFSFIHGEVLCWV